MVIIQYSLNSANLLELLVTEGEASGERQFAEEVGLLFEGFGFSRMTGRILGWLLICDPPRQSSSDLAAALGASKGSISTATRFLISAGMIERIAVPGARGHFFEIRPETLLRAHDQLGTFRTFQDLMNKGLAVLGDEDSPRAKRLRRTRDLYAFLEREFPGLVERFEAEYPD
ncbi:MAG: MarR family transcriptional regulator [Streptosporangiales bacterium]|nr:MarR family transcriptional regulator [Streptosporangiales bacterium]